MKLWLNTIADRPALSAEDLKGKNEDPSRGVARLSVLASLVGAMEADSKMALGTGKVLVLVTDGESEGI